MMPGRGEEWWQALLMGNQNISACSGFLGKKGYTGMNTIELNTSAMMNI